MMIKNKTQKKITQNDLKKYKREKIRKLHQTLSSLSTHFPRITGIIIIQRKLDGKKVQMVRSRLKLLYKCEND